MFSKVERPGIQACQVKVGIGICGESQTLNIINEFKKLYHEKMTEIDSSGGGDCLLEKIKLQEEWIGDLTEQNDMLVKAVEELEHEATQRVRALEEKLQQSAKCICEVMNKYRQYDVTNELLAEPLEKIFRLENDRKNLLEFIRRIREEKQWYFDGLNFYEISYSDLFGNDLMEKYKENDKSVNGDDEQEEQKAAEKESVIEKLTRNLDYYKPFGDVAVLNHELTCKKEECESLKQSMVDMRQALTEEVASKHDTVLQLKRECQELEERCIQADKQTAFRDDIIKELRKEIKQLKQQLTQDEVLKLNATIDGLKKNFEQSKRLQDDEDRVKQEEIFKLRRTIENLQGHLQEAEELERANNQNTRSLLKEAEEKAKVCKICKGRSKVGFAEHAEVQVDVDREQFEKQMELLQNREEIIKVQTHTLDLVQNELGALKQRETEILLERERHNNDVNSLKNRINELENMLRDCEGKTANLQKAGDNKQVRSQMKKLAKQKTCYEEVIAYFKQEMGLMSEQLHSLQELLVLSQASVHKDHDKLQRAFLSVSAINEQLSCQLSAAEQKVQLENQMNQLHETKICELERMISDKAIDLGKHDSAIWNIRQTLQYSLKQNEELHGTIISLNGTILQLQNAIKKYELDNNRSKETTACCQNQIDICKKRLSELKQAMERKTAELCKLEMAYNNQNRTLQSAQLELQEMKDNQVQKQCHLKCIIGELAEKVEKSEEKYNELAEAYRKLETQMDTVARREHVQDVEIERYRKIVGDLKKTLINLNQSLTKKDFKSKCQNEECKKYSENPEKATDPETCLTCHCEADFYQSIVETLKKSVTELKKKLIDSQQQNQELEEKCKCTEARYSELTKTQEQKDKEYYDLRRKLNEKLHQAQQEESRYLELASQFERELGSIRQELEVRTIQLNDVKKSAQEINGTRCVQLACAQEEVNQLKEELNELLRKQCALNVENDKLHSQSEKMKSTVTNLEEKSQLLRGQVEQYLQELQTVQTEKESLVHKNQELLAELRTLQSSASKQQRCAFETLKTLESELSDVKQSRDEVCLESKNVISYIRSWLQEQKKINEYVATKEKNYCFTIERLKQENEEMHFPYTSKTPRCPKSFPPCMHAAGTSPPPPPPPRCQSPWSLGSQGTASYRDESYSGSPCLNEDCDWYSTNFRNYSEEEDDEDWVSKVEDLAAQVRRTNKMWKSKLGEPECAECLVSRDTKK